MTRKKQTKLFEESQLLTIDEIKRLTNLVFIPSGYTVQLKDVENKILWEDSQTTLLRGDNRGQQCYKVNFGRDYPCPHCTALKSIENLTPQIKEDRSIIDGKWFRVVALPIMFQGKIAAIELIQDITSEKLQKQFFDSLLSKDSLVLNIVRHDIPNYLNIINMALDSLKISKNFGEEEKRFLEIAQSNTAHTISILEELRDLSRLEDPLTNLEQVKLIPILQQSIEEISSMYTDKTLQTNIDIQIPEDSAIIWANKLLTDIFLNILTNTVKYSPASIVQVDISITIYVDDQEYIQVKFDDYGTGIPPEILEVLFNRAARIDHGWKASKGSTGLGVSIIKSLVDIFGGNLFYLNRIKNDWTKGTTVILRFPQVRGEV